MDGPSNVLARRGVGCGPSAALSRHCAMDHLWAALPDELRQLVVTAFVRDATSSDLALVAPLSPAFLTAVRDERERRTTSWRGGPWRFGLDNADPTPDAEIVMSWKDELDDQYATSAELESLILIRACDSGDLEVVQRQIAKGVPVDFTSSLDTPLYRAVSNGHSTCVRALLAARASLLDCWEDRGAGIFSSALYKGHLNVVKVLTEFGVPRWGRTFLDDSSTFLHVRGELWAAEYCGKLTQEIQEFLVATRKFNPRAGDPAVYIRLQAEENMARLMEGSEEEQLEGVQALDFMAWGHVGYKQAEYHHELFIQATHQLLPSLRTAVISNRFKGQVLAAVLELIQHIKLEEGAQQLAQLEEKLSHDRWDAVPERASLWAELKAVLSDYPQLRTYLVPPEDFGPD